MARISSQTLFNFTDTIEFLIDNLENGFYCHTTFEKLPYGKNGYRVPMACFCDIPLSLIKEHFNWYGRYGIGIKKSYGRELGVKPVWYITSESELVRSFVKSKALADHERKHLLPFMKQYLGNQYFAKMGEEKRKKFYDEREWRYIPKGSSVETFFGECEIREMSIAVQTNQRMKLDLSQIEYIIIEKDSDFELMLDKLKQLSVDRDIRYETLISKLITSRQIEQDF